MLTSQWSMSNHSEMMNFITLLWTGALKFTLNLHLPPKNINWFQFELRWSSLPPNVTRYIELGICVIMK